MTQTRPRRRPLTHQEKLALQERKQRRRDPRARLFRPPGFSAPILCRAFLSSRSTMTHKKTEPLRQKRFGCVVGLVGLEPMTFTMST